MEFNLPFTLPLGWDVKTVECLIAEDILEKPLDGNHGGIHPKSSDYVKFGVPFIMASDLNNGAVDFGTCSFISVSQASQLQKGFAKTGDVLLSHKATIGRTAIVQESEFDFIVLTPQITYYRIKNGLKLNNQYLKAYFDSSFFQGILGSWAGSGSTRAYLGITAQLKLPIIVPPIERQYAIAEQLFSINKKIELNRQTNQTLEQIAQALFKSWFVDFEPTRAKIAAKEAGASPEEIERAAMCAISGKTPDQLAQLPPETQQNLKTTAALFPDVLVDSELGEIPEGWEVKSFGDVSNCFDSKRVPLSKPQREKKKPGDYPYYGATSVMDYVNEWIFDGIYLLLGEDGSVAKEDGTPFTQYVWGKTWVNNHAHVLQGKDTVSTEHLMLFIQTQNIAAYITGAVQQKLNQGNMNSIPFIFADRQINEVFFQSIKSLYAQIRNLTEEIQRLENLRKLLLPKLLSGEIDLNSNFSVEE